MIKNIDKTGKLVIPCKWDEAKVFKNGVAIVEDDEGDQYLINKKGKKVKKLD